MAKEPAVQFIESESEKVCVIAGPGTGKSYGMTERIKRLLNKQVEPEDILVLTFTSVSAQDLRKDIGGIKNIDKSILKRIEVTTLHSLALRIWLSENDNIRIMHDFEVKAMIRDLDPDIGKYQKKEKLYKNCKKNSGSRLLTDDEKQFLENKNVWLNKHKAVILDDLIPKVCELLKKESVRKEWNYQQVMVDEYQDLNRTEQEFVELLIADDGKLAVIGDDDQAIYEFKGSYPQGIRDFADKSGCEKISYTECRRCPSNIVDMANNLIGHNYSDKKDQKTFAPLKKMKPGEYKIVKASTPSDEVNKLHTIIQDAYSELQCCDKELGWNQIVVLAPTKDRGRAIYNILKKKNIPVTYCFRNAIFDNEKIRETFSLLSLAANPDDLVSWRYLLGFGNRECNAKSYKHIQEHVTSDINILDVLRQCEAKTITIPYTHAIVDRFSERNAQLEKIKKNPQILMEGLSSVETQFFHDILQRAIDLKMNSEGFPGVLREVRDELYSPEAAAEANSVRIMSLHAAKGLSAGVVIIMSAVDGLIPLKSLNNTLEEQRRLFYVAITRCKGTDEDNKIKYPYTGKLVISYFENSEDGSIKCDPTPFLGEM